MIEFIAHIIQSGEGCDYMISCGETLLPLIAKTKEEAIKELKEKVIGKYDPKYNCYEEGYQGEQELSRVTLYEISNMTPIPVDEWYKEAEKYIKKEEKKLTEEKEKIEYEKLKSKYEK